MTDISLYFFKIVKDFLVEYLQKQRRVSSCTVKSYKETLNQFITFLSNKNNISFRSFNFSLISRESTEEYLSWVENEKLNSVSTRNQRLACIKAFIRHAASRNLTLQALCLEISKIPQKKADMTNRLKFFDEKTLEILLVQPDVTKPTGFRDRFLMILLYDTGARIQEILDLKVDSLHVNTPTPFVELIGKGNKTRLVPIMEKTTQHLASYMATFHPNPLSNDFLFYTILNNLPKQLTQDAVAKMLSKYALSARKIYDRVPERLTCHMFRHSRAMHLYRNNMPLPLISEWLGHKSLTTTLVYANADTAMKQSAINKATACFNPAKAAPVIYREIDDDVFKRLYGLK
jgi:site-specific recombinase XerD